MSCLVKPFPHSGGFFNYAGEQMDQAQKQALQVTKEIVVKFIEVGRISPNNCHEFFSQIYRGVLQTIVNGDKADFETSLNEEKAE
jgi:hypothetical protein